MTLKSLLTACAMIACAACTYNLGKVRPGDVAAHQAALDAALAGPERVAPERDHWRHPRETLTFFDVEPGQVVVEIWPGGGWYTAILGPYLDHPGGRLVAAGFDPGGSAYARKRVAQFQENFVSRPEIFGQIDVSVLSAKSGPMVADGAADVVLTFRNVHNWMSGGYADKVFADAYRALKPGGVLGVVEHRLPEDQQFDPRATNGYVKQSTVIAMAERAGFRLESSSDINANPSDGADHPFGVWTLPPVRRSAPRGAEPNPLFDHSRYDAIGESDRMTLKFRKPA